MATAHLIHGGVGAGKTTFAKQLEIEPGALRFTHDEWMSALYGADPPELMFAEYYRRVADLMEPLWLRALALGVDVVLDFGFWRRGDRDDVRAKVEAVGAAVLLYDLACDGAEAWRRVERRNTDLGGALLITRDTFELLCERVEPLGADEARVVVDGAIAQATRARRPA
jgi:predicted kinase